MRCSYCEDGEFKENMVKPPDCIGGYINGYWFCQWCLEYGMSDRTDSEKERIELLSEIAEQKSFTRKIIKS